MMSKTLEIMLSWFESNIFVLKQSDIHGNNWIIIGTEHLEDVAINEKSESKNCNKYLT